MRHPIIGDMRHSIPLINMMIGCIVLSQYEWRILSIDMTDHLTYCSSNGAEIRSLGSDGLIRINNILVLQA